MKPVYVPKTAHEKALQRALLQFRRPQNHALVREALRTANREDLIGFDKKCLVPPEGYVPRAYKPKKKADAKPAAKKPEKPQRVSKASPRQTGKPGARRTRSHSPKN